MGPALVPRPPLDASCARHPTAQGSPPPCPSSTAQTERFLEASLLAPLCGQLTEEIDLLLKAEQANSAAAPCTTMCNGHLRGSPTFQSPEEMGSETLTEKHSDPAGTHSDDAQHHLRGFKVNGVTSTEQNSTFFNHHPRVIS